MNERNEILEHRGQFKVTQRKIAYENPWIRVVEDAVIRPDGSPGIFGVIEVGRGKGGVAVLPVDNDFNIYLIKEFMYAVNRYDVEVCGGGIGEAEEALTAAQRELEEEFGIQAQNWIDFGSVGHATTIMRGGARLFVAQGFDAQALKPETGAEIVRYSLEDAVGRVMRGEIFASTTCCIILKAARHFGI